MATFCRLPSSLFECLNFCHNNPLQRLDQMRQTCSGLIVSELYMFTMDDTRDVKWQRLSPELKHMIGLEVD